MDNIFIDSFLTILQALAKIFLIAFVAGVLVRRKVLNQTHINAMSSVTVMVLLPCLIFFTITQDFNPGNLPFWWALPIGSILFALLGLGITALFFLPNVKKHRDLLPVASMQNAAYLILPIGELVYREQFNEFAVYVFLVVLGLSPLIWTYGKYLESPSSLNGRTITQVVTPPFVANILAITLVMLRLNDNIPGVIVESAELLGRATVPVATFILGATLGTVFMRLPSFNEIIKVSVVKFVLMPAMMIGILYLLDLGSGYPLLADFLVIQAASAPATAHILIARTYGGDIDRIGGIIFVSYFITIIAIPFWLAVWRIL